MTLREVSTLEQLDNYYEVNGLSVTEDRINALKDAMGVITSRCDEDETPEEVLAGLQETVLLGYWKAS